MPIQSMLALAGIAKQTAKGSAAANPTYDFGLLDGAVLRHEVDQDLEETTLDVRTRPGVNRTRFVPGQEYSARAYPKVVGLWLYGALGAISTSAPAGGVYTHTITPASDLPYLTLFGRQGAEYLKIPDAKLDELTLTFDGPGPIEIGASFWGLNYTPLGSAWTATNNERDAGGKLRAGGGTFKLDVASATAVTAPIKSGELSISNNVDPQILAASILPTDVPVGAAEIEASMVIVPEDFADFREWATGTAAGTTVSESPIFGSFEWKFVIDANTDLTIAATRVAFTAEWPDADPGGGAVELELTGGVVNPAAGATLTATLRNTVVSY